MRFKTVYFQVSYYTLVIAIMFNNVLFFPFLIFYQNKVLINSTFKSQNKKINTSIVLHLFLF